MTEGYTVKTQKKKLIDLIGQIMVNITDDQLLCPILPKWLRVLPSMNINSVRSIISCQTTYDEAERFFKQWCEKRLHQVMVGFEKEFNEKIVEVGQKFKNTLDNSVSEIKDLSTKVVTTQVEKVQETVNVQRPSTKKDEKQSWTQVVKNKRKKKTKPTVMVQNIGTSCNYPTKNVALHITASHTDTEKSVKTVVENALKNFTCDINVQNITVSEKFSTFRAQIINMPKSTESNFYTKLIWPYGWFVRGWSGSVDGKIKKILRLHISRLQPHQEIDPLVELLKKKFSEMNLSIKSEFLKVNISKDSSRKLLTKYKSCKMLITGEEMPKLNN